MTKKYVYSWNKRYEFDVVFKTPVSFGRLRQQEKGRTVSGDN